MIPNLNKTQRLAFMQDKAFEKLWQEADEAGIQAATKMQPQPMIVEGRSNPLDDTSAVTNVYYVEGGVCGFAWLECKGNTTFGKWLVRAKVARKGYPTGLTIWCHRFGQSMERKTAWAYATAAYLQTHGQITVYPMSRMD